MESYGSVILHQTKAARFQKYQKPRGSKADLTFYLGIEYIIQVNEPDPNSFSYGIMFNYPKSATVFMVKVTCYVSGKASLHLKSGDNNKQDKRLS